jgi:hypothetical protein
MDSTAYLYLIRRMETINRPGCGTLAESFHHSKERPFEITAEECSRFLAIMAADGGTAQIGRPSILDVPDNAFAGLFRRAHAAVIEVLDGKNPTKHDFGSAGVEMTRLLCRCAVGRAAFEVSLEDALFLTMSCFLLEAAVSFGWCDELDNGTAKRAAHAHFLAFRKSLCRLSPNKTAAAIGYLGCAWALAQNTDLKYGACGSRIAPLPDAFIAWENGAEKNFYIAKSNDCTRDFFVLNRGGGRIAHPFGRFESEKTAGVAMYANEERIFSSTPPAVSEIIRKKITGYKFVYLCRSASIPDIAWISVFLWVDATVYRSDILRIPGFGPRVRVRGELSIECDAALVESGPGFYFGEGAHNTVVRFIENMPGFHSPKIKPSGLNEFVSRVCSVVPGEAVRFTYAWARGKGITDVSPIKLLGIYDEPSPE